MKILVSHLIKQNWIDPQYGDRVVLQYKSVLQNEVKLRHEEFNPFERSKYRLDECSFSLGKSFIVENISEESIRNKKLIKDHMLASNVTPSTIQITKKMQTDYKCARTKYETPGTRKKRRRAKSKTITKIHHK